METLHLGEGILARLLEQAHQVDVELGAEAKEDETEAKVGDDCDEGITGEGAQEEQARAGHKTRQDRVLPPEQKIWS